MTTFYEIFFQVWFQNRRAKFRRNERSLSLQQSSPTKLSCNKTMTPSRTESMEKPLFSHQNIIPSHAPSDLQYVMPWKCTYPDYNQSDIYSNNFNSAVTGQGYPFLPTNPFNYCSTNITSSSICNRFDVNSLRYRHQEFTLSP